MQNLLLRIFLLVYLFSDILNVFDISAQCPGAATCSEAYTFCSLDELNGFSCSTFGMGDMDCRPGCASGGSQYKRDWWAFVSQGGNVSITLQVGPCNPLAWQFLVMGIWGGCNCTDEVFCQSGLYIPSGGSYTYQVNLKPCKVYYLMLDGGWPIYPCDFTITTSGGGPPKLDPLGFINNLPSGVISPVCLGYCGYKFHVNSQTGNCLNSKYVWTLDDIEVGTNSNDLILDFPKVGDFKLCVKAFGDLNGSICSTEGPICTTVKVSALQDKTRPDATVCSGTQWFSQTIFSSGTYREHFKDINCCEYDSVVNFKIRPDPLPGKVFYFNCDNKPYKDILGRSYSMCEDNLEIILPKSTESYKCDSSFILTAITLDLRPQWTSKCLGSMVQLTPNFNQLKKCNNGESYRFENKWFKKSDNSKILGTADSLIVDAIDDDYCIERRTVVFHGKDSAFCTKVFCENFNESKSGNSIQNINLNACDSANINGQTYTSSTQFTQQLKNIFNCDSIIITELKINPSSSSMLKFNFCDSININKQTYYQSGIFKQNLLNSLGCDSIIQIDLKGYLSGKSILNINSCDSTSVNGIKYFQSGNYSQMLQTTGGCDSILDLNISLFKGTSSKYSFSSCDSIIFNGQSYTKSGDYFQNFKSANGCDSNLIVHINIPSSTNTVVDQSSCDSFVINNIKYVQSGNYSQLLKSSNGCDSTINLKLNILNSNSSILSLTSCDSAIINGQKYIQSGKYVQVLQNTNQCDSTLNIDLNISKSNATNLNQSSCDSAIVNGKIYTQSGNYTQVLQNANACDSILNLNLLISKSSTSLLNLTSCDSVFVNGQKYIQSGNYIQTLQNINQCDSTLKLNLTISKSNVSNLNLTACDSIIINTQLYKQSGNYSQLLQNTNLCDSLLNINLSIYNSQFSNLFIGACDSALVNGKIYKQSGIYTQFLKTKNQCDSLLKIQFTVLSKTGSIINQSACDSISFNGVNYFTSGSYEQKLINSEGCDSIIKLELIIKPAVNYSLEAGIDTTICEGETLRLFGLYNGNTKVLWQSSNRGNFDFPDSLITNYSPYAVGTETIYLIASTDCKQLRDSFKLEVLPSQNVQITGDTILLPCKEYKFSASGGINYHWTPVSLIECLDPACSHVKLKSNAAAQFSITSDGPCIVSANLNLSLANSESEIYFPNVFSPNGDNINDLFLPVSNCDKLNLYLLQIFDRWGNLVFESHDKDFGWNGKYKNINLNPGVYPFIIQVKFDHGEKLVKTGNVTLIR